MADYVARALGVASIAIVAVSLFIQVQTGRERIANSRTNADIGQGFRYVGGVNMDERDQHGRLLPPSDIPTPQRHYPSTP